MKKSTQEFYVSYYHGITTEIYDIYTTRKGAVKVNDVNNDNHEKIVFLDRPYRVITLSEAMEKLAEYFQESGEESMRCRITGDETILY